MIAEHGVLELVQESFDSLYRVGFVKHATKVNGDTVVPGTRSTLDSIAFGTLVADFEQQLDREHGAPIYIVSSDVHKSNPSAGTPEPGMIGCGSTGYARHDDQ